VVGEPSLAALRATPRRDFAFELEVRVPDSMVVAAGGLPSGREAADGRASYRFRSGRPVPFLNVTVAPYRVFERGGIRAYVLPADSARGPGLLDAIERSLQWLTARFGELPRPPAFAVMEIPDGWGSQAQLDAGIMIEASALRRVEDRRALYHELSHLWNAPDAELPSARWNEGLATYLEHRLAADLDGGDAQSSWSAIAQSVCRRVVATPALRATPLADYGGAGMTGSSYSVGALFFAVLHGVLGAERFDAAYRSLYQASRASSVSLAALEASFVRADPRARRVVDEWVRTTRWSERLCPAADLVGTVRAYADGM
jgi:aminopeptidase N